MIFNDILQFIIAPLFVLGVTGLVTLTYRDGKARKNKVIEVDTKVQELRSDFNNLRNYLVGDPKIVRDKGALGDIDDKLDEILKSAK